MCKRQSIFKSLVAGVLAISATTTVWTQTCPSDATDTAVGVALAAFRINPSGTTGPTVGPNPIGICECIRLRMSITYVPIGPSGGKTAFFRGGTMSVRNLAGTFTDDVTPASGVPLIGEPTDPNGQACGPGAVNFFLSDFSVDYCVRPADIDANGNITFLANYTGGLLLFGSGITNQPTGTTAIQVHVDQGPSCSIAPQSQAICAGGSATFTVTGSGPAPPFTFTWTGPGGFTATGPTIAVGVAGTYTATVHDAHGCTSTCTANLIVNPPPSCTITPPTATHCVGQSQDFTINIASGTAPFTVVLSGCENVTLTGQGRTITRTVTCASPGTCTLTANITDANGCSGGPCTATLVCNSCAPRIQVLKEVACATPTGCPASGYAKSATGVKDSSCPAFCYRITVTNPATNPDGSANTTPLVNITLSDPSLNLTACNAALAGVTLQPGQSTTPCITGPVEHCSDFVNTVTARAASAFDISQTVTATDTATVRVLNINIVCNLTLFSSFDMDSNPNDSHVTLPSGSVDTPITVNLTLQNSGTAPLDVTTVNGLPALVDCTSGAAVTLPLPIHLDAGGSFSVSGCVSVSCPGAQFSVSAHAEANDQQGTLCVYNTQGSRVTDDSAPCTANVTCEQAVTCRVTGGGVLLPDFVDQSCIEVATTIFPATSPNGLTVDKITHGGQLGAPFSQEDCGAILGNPCIRGQWQHVRHYAGTANPRDVIDMDFHSQTPKGQYDSLNCACLGCCDPATGAFITPVTLNGICNPDDHKVCGPQPRPAPANAIIWSGIGKVTPTDDVRGSRAAQAEWVVFRVYIEDRSEPGGGHPGGAVEPADIYCFQAWKTGIKVSKKPDFSTIATAFRSALGQANCDFLNALAGGSLAIGSLPSPTVNGVTADIQDCGPLHDGNHQIHPGTGATCTATP